jgi:hypothetical protein
MKESKDVLPVFKALMAIVYVILGAVILVKPTFLLPDHTSISIGFGLILVLYGIIRAYTSFINYSSILREKHDENL